MENLFLDVYNHGGWGFGCDSKSWWRLDNARRIKKIPAKVGDVIVTSAGALSAKHIFHAITLGPVKQKTDVQQIIRETTQRSLSLLEALGLNSIAFPAIGAGSAGFNYEDVAVVMADVITNYLNSSSRAIHVTIFLYDPFRTSQIDFFSLF